MAQELLTPILRLSRWITYQWGLDNQAALDEMQARYLAATNTQKTDG
jgi:hypothetical protein